MQREASEGKTAANLRKLPLLLIFLTVFIDLVGFGIIIPFLPKYAEKFGADAFTVGLLLASYSLMQLIFVPVLGRLSDNIGRRPIILLSLLASAVGYTLWGLAGSLPMLFLSRIIAGAGNGNLAVAQAYIADVTSAENRAKGMGLIGAAFGLGFTIGPAIGGLCARSDVSGAGHLAGFVAAGFSLLDLGLSFFFLPEPSQRSRAAHDRFAVGPAFIVNTLTDQKLRLPLLIFFLFTFAFANMEATLVLLAAKQFGFTDEQNSWMFAYIGLIMVFFQGGMIGRLSKRFGEKHLVTAGCLCAAVGLLLTPLSPSSAVLYFALFLLAIGSGMNNPSNQSILSQLAPEDRVGGVLGVGQSLSTLGRILGPTAGGWAFSHVGYASPYYLGSIVMVASLLLSLRLPTLQPRQREMT